MREEAGRSASWGLEVEPGKKHQISTILIYEYSQHTPNWCLPHLGFLFV